MASVPFWLMKKKPYQQGLGFNTATEDYPHRQPPLRSWPHGYPAPGHWGGYKHSLGPTIVQRDEKPISDPTVSYSINPNLNPSIPDDFIRSGIEALHGKDEGGRDAAGNPAMYLMDEDSPYLQAQGRANAREFPEMPWHMRNLTPSSSTQNKGGGGNIFSNLFKGPKGGSKDGFKRVLKHLGAMESPGPDWSLQAQNVGVRSPWSPTNVAWSPVGGTMFDWKKKRTA